MTTDFPGAKCPNCNSVDCIILSRLCDLRVVCLACGTAPDKPKFFRANPGVKK